MWQIPSTPERLFVFCVISKFFFSNFFAPNIPFEQNEYLLRLLFYHDSSTTMTQNRAITVPWFNASWRGFENFCASLDEHQSKRFSIHESVSRSFASFARNKIWIFLINILLFIYLQLVWHLLCIVNHAVKHKKVFEKLLFFGESRQRLV